MRLCMEAWCVVDACLHPGLHSKCQLLEQWEDRNEYELTAVP